MLFDKNSDTFIELKNKISSSQHTVVPFLGAGISSYGIGDESLPLWRGLLYKLIHELELNHLTSLENIRSLKYKIDEGELISTTDLILQYLGEPHFKRIIRNQLDVEQRDIPPAITELISMGWNLFVTTNLDRFIEKAFLKKYHKEVSVITNRCTDDMAKAISGSYDGPFPHLVKLHGCVNNYPSWCLTLNHYKELLKDPRYVQALRSLYLKNIFFIGFGLQDHDFDFILEFIAAVFPAGAGNLYALMASDQKGKPYLVSLIRDHGLRVIYFEKEDTGAEDPYGGYRAVHQCIAELAKGWVDTEERLRTRWIYFPQLTTRFYGRQREEQRVLKHLISEKPTLLQIVGFGGQGKTSLIQSLIKNNKLKLYDAGFTLVFACSFYKADANTFVSEIERELFGDDLLTNISEKVKKIVQHLNSKKVLAILDGMEAISTKDGFISNINISEIINGIIKGGGSVIFTSRLSIHLNSYKNIEEINLDALGEKDFLSFLDDWGLLSLPQNSIKKIEYLTQRHPLSLRILVSFLANMSAKDTVRTLEDVSLMELRDEADPLLANKTSRVLSQYTKYLDGVFVSFLSCFSIFIKPVSLEDFENVFTKKIDGFNLNTQLLNIDLRAIIIQLIERRLLIQESESKLSTHPTVREYFGKLAEQHDHKLDSLHGAYAYSMVSKFKDVEIESYRDAIPIIQICFHAAKSKQWSMFHQYFYVVLNKRFRNYLCNNLGAWDEFLDLVKLVYEDEDLNKQPLIVQDYYAGSLARAYKHTGRVSQAIEAYRRCFLICQKNKSIDTAKYLNNYLTLLIWAGDIKEALKVSLLNIKALSWIAEDWIYCWQYEHGFSSIGYLFLLAGEYTTAEKYYHISEGAWSQKNEKKRFIYEYYVYYRSELFIETKKPYSFVVQYVEDKLSTAIENNWPESICKAHIALSLIYRSQAKTNANRTYFLEKSADSLAMAAKIDKGLSLPETELAYETERLRLIVDKFLLLSLEPEQLKQGLLSAERCRALIESCGFRLFEPEIDAYESLVLYLNGCSKSKLIESANKILTQCGNSYTFHFVKSPNCLVHVLLAIAELNVDLNSKIAEKKYFELEKSVSETLSSNELKEFFQR